MGMELSPSTTIQQPASLEQQRRNRLEAMCVALLSYYEGSRGAGHTKLLIHGAKSQRCILLADTEHRAESVHRDIAANHIQHQALPNSYLGLKSVTHLHGMRLPLAIDNSALIVLLREIVDVLSNEEGQS